MDSIVFLIERYGLLAVFLSVLLEEAGLPLPSYPVLMVSAALSWQGGYRLPEIVATGVFAALLADFGWYWSGGRYGTRVLRTLCRISLSPDSCVRDTQSMFARIGPVSLSFSKFIPGLSNIAVALAGANRVSLASFALFDAIGAVLYVGTGVLLGAVFHDAIDNILTVLTQFGRMGILLVATALALFLLWKWTQRQLFRRQLRIDRITVDELRALIDRGDVPVILDIRSAVTRAQEGVIPGAIFANASELELLLADLSLDAEIVVYCSCPSEASAVMACKHLRKAGFKKIRPLLGGIDAWSRAGHPIDLVAAL